MRIGKAANNQNIQCIFRKILGGRGSDRGGLRKRTVCGSFQFQDRFESKEHVLRLQLREYDRNVPQRCFFGAPQKFEQTIL
jgi:hypothetical protein